MSIWGALGAMWMFAASATSASATDVYVGEPFSEALFDLATNSVMVAHPLSGGTELRRTDVFRMSDGRFVALTSTAEKTNEPFTVQGIQLGGARPESLIMRTPSVQSISWEIREK